MNCDQRTSIVKDVAAHFVKIPWPCRPSGEASCFRERLKFAPNTCPGPDGLRFAHLQAMGEPVCTLLAELYELWLDRGVWLAPLSDTYFVALAKPTSSHCPTPTSVRPIALSNCTGKLLTAQLASWLSGIVPPHILSIQHGFLSGRGTSEGLLELEYHALTLAPLSDRHMLLLLDVARAFPSLLHEHIFACVEGANAPKWLRVAIKSLYRGMSGRFVFQGRLSYRFALRKGVRQGCPLSSLIFAWALDGILRWTIAAAPPSSHLSAFADDLAIILAATPVGLQFLRALQRALALVCGLLLNHDKIVCVPLSPQVHSRCVDVLKAVGPGWENISESELATYLGYAVGPKFPLGVWDRVSNKIRQRIPAVTDLAVGAPALMYLAKGLLWSCAAHQLTLYQSDAVLEAVFKAAQAELMRGPKGWMNYAVSINLRELGWLHPPVPVRSLALRLQFAFVLRKAAHPFLQRFDAIKSAVINDDAPLIPFLRGWALHGAYASLKQVIDLAVNNNVASLDRHGQIRVSSRIRELQMSRAAFIKVIDSWIRSPGEPLAYSSQIVWTWLARRMAKTWGSPWDRHRSVGRARDYLIFVSRLCPPREHNALLRLLTGGVYLWSVQEELFERHCMLVKGCLGENSLDHYVRSRCWHHSSLSLRHPISLCLLDIIMMQPTSVRARAVAKLAYTLVKALNLARHLAEEKRPLNMVLHCALYR